MLFLFLFANRI